MMPDGMIFDFFSPVLGGLFFQFPQFWKVAVVVASTGKRMSVKQCLQGMLCVPLPVPYSIPS